MLNRRWAIIAGLGVIQLWIIGLALRSIAGAHDGATPIPSSTGTVIPGAETIRTIETGPTPHVVIDDENTPLVITVRPGATVSVDDRAQRHGWVVDGGRRVQIERTDDGLRLSRGSGTTTIMFGSFERQLAVIVPPGTRLDVRNAGAMSVTGLRADATLHSDDGNVVVSDHQGDLHVTSDSGRIELNGVEARYIEANTNDGRILFDRVRADEVTATTSDGRIDVSQSVLRGGQLQTEDGRVTVGLEPESNVTISARTSSGKIIAQSSQIVTGGGDDDDAPTTIRIGNGAGKLDVRSDDGSISIRTVGV